MNPLEAALSSPWAALRELTDDPLHPGGVAATRDLMDRADVAAGTRLLDAGCGGGESLALAAERGARPVHEVAGGRRSARVERVVGQFAERGPRVREGGLEGVHQSSSSPA